MKHISDSDIRRYYSRKLSSEEEGTLFIHIAQCDFCAGRLASAFPEKEMLAPPPGMHSDILLAAGKIPSRKERQREFYRYSTKVVLAMGMALSLLVLCNFPDTISRTRTSDVQYVLAPESRQEGSIPAEKTDGREAYRESLQEQQKKNKEAQEKFLQDKQAQEEKRREKQSDSFSAGLKKFSSDILSYFKSE